MTEQGEERIESPAQALVAAVRLIGGQAKTARLLGTSQPAVWAWIHRKKPLPAEHVLAVEAATKFAISKYDLRPDVYGPAPDTLDQPNSPASECAQ